MNLNLHKKERSQNKIFFYLLFASVIYLAYKTAEPLFSMIILAIIIATVFHPLYKWLKLKSRGREMFAVPLTMLAILLSLIIPVIIVIIVTIGQFNIFISDIANFAGNNEEISELLNLSNEDQSEIEPQDIEETVQTILDDVNERLQTLPFVSEDSEIELADVQDFVGEAARELATWLGETAINAAQNAPLFITNLIVFIIILSTFIAALPKFKNYILKLSPLDNKIDKLYMEKVEAMTNAMVRGTFVVATAQGLVSGFLLLLAGVPYVVFWTFLSIFANIIPNGGAIVQIPILIALIATGNIPGALIVLLGNTILVASIDNLMRPYLVPKEAQIHPALILIGVVGGIQVFGFLGFIYGPVIMIFLITTFDIYLNHYKEDGE